MNRNRVNAGTHPSFVRILPNELAVQALKRLRRGSTFSPNVNPDSNETACANWLVQAMPAQNESTETEAAPSTASAKPRRFFGPPRGSTEKQKSSPRHFNNRRNGGQIRMFNKEMENSPARNGSAPKKRQQRTFSDQLGQEPKLIAQGSPVFQLKDPIMDKEAQEKAQIIRSYSLSQQRPNSTQRARNIAIFKPYMDEVELQQGLEKGTIIQGAIRINQRKYEEAFINNPDGSDQADIAILGMADRNRALHGDVVAVCIRPRAFWVVNEELYSEWKKECRPKNSKSETEGISEELAEVPELLSEIISAVSDMDAGDSVADDLVIASTSAESPVQQAVVKDKTKKKPTYRILSQLPLDDWDVPDSCLQKTAEVVGILEKKNSRLATGKLELASAAQRQWAKFSPSDSRIPRMMIGASQLPHDFFDRPQDFAKFLFVAKIADWPENSMMAYGNLEKQLGLAGDIDAETEGLLITNEIDTREFSEDVVACLPSIPETGWQISEEELGKRRDFRDEIIFTIDPKTARDLDDALSVVPCDDVNGAGLPGWEVGVHIADVSYFVHENTVLDEWASQRANSVYLVQEVIPMLPRLLCEELCSLNAGVDRLTFSVIFKMDENGDVYDEWFGRSVIRSRVKLTYEHAQDFIENPDKDFMENEMPEISDNVTVHQIKEKVLQLDRLAKALRAKRRQCGSLQLDQPKLKFALDDDNKMPIGVSIYQAKDSNRLVEEFMLLANMAVARKIERHYRKTALLRMHPPPKAKVLKESVTLCNSIGFPINGTSSQQLSSALAPFRSNSQLMRSINQVLSLILMKAMELARYFCTGSVKSQSAYHHFALNVPFYTHFTSPIRRYPDIIVHRSLAAALGYCEPSERSVDEIQKIAEHCNDKKLIAKKVSESSAELFFGVLIHRVGPMEAKGVVVNVLDAAFDVLLFKYGVIKRVYINTLEMRQAPSFLENPNRLVLYWENEDGKFEQLIQMCTVVEVILSKLPEPTKFQAVIKPRPIKDSPTLMQMYNKQQTSGGDSTDLNFDSLLLD